MVSEAMAEECTRVLQCAADDEKTEKMVAHIVVLDWHTTQLQSSVSATAIRLAMRDAFFRFIYQLFRLVHHSTKPLIVLATSGHDEQYVPRLVPIVELDAIQNVSVGGVLQRLRTTQQHGASVLSASNLVDYTKALVEQLSDWARSRTIVPFMYIFCACSISNAISQALSMARSALFSSNSTHIFPCSLSSSPYRHLSEILARLLQTNVSLRLPSANSAALSLTLGIRPRVLTNCVEYPTSLVATRRVTMCSVREDILHGTPFVIWARRMNAHHERTLCILRDAIRRLNEMGEALVCVATASESQKLYIVMGCENSLDIMLVREVAHADTFLPVPSEVMMMKCEKQDDGGTHDEMAMHMLSSEGFRAQETRIGGLGSIRERSKEKCSNEKSSNNESSLRRVKF